jgi:hypothetical protein
MYTDSTLQYYTGKCMCSYAYGIVTCSYMYALKALYVPFPVSFMSTVYLDTCSHVLIHVHVCFNRVCSFMLLILPVLRGLTTLGRWWSGEFTPPTLNSSLDPSTRGIHVYSRVFEVLL